MTSIPHPIPYQGSKRQLAPAVLRYFPAGVQTLFEPFAGSAAITLSAAAGQLAHHYHLNDLNQPLMQLWQLMVEQPAATATAYATLWHAQHPHSVAHYVQIREQFNQTQDPHLFLYLLARCVKGAVRYNAQGEFNQSPDKRRHGVRPETLQKNIEATSHLLKDKTTFSAVDYQAVLELAQPYDLVYLDPPYQGVSGRKDARYYAGLDHAQFVLALEKLNERLIPYLVSYDGRRGNQKYGCALPLHLQLTHLELEAGRSTQATLLGRSEITYESLYLSPALVQKLNFYFAPNYLSHSYFV